MDHVYNRCTNKRCTACRGTGHQLDADQLVAGVGPCHECDGRGHLRCSGCRNEGMDCTYEALSCCGVCQCYEGSLLPFCPERTIDFDEQQRFYKHYCAGTGPFARATLATVGAAYEACYDRLYKEVGSMPPHREGARRLFHAVCALQVDDNV